jgi:hypothetical protein
MQRETNQSERLEKSMRHKMADSRKGERNHLIVGVCGSIGFCRIHEKWWECSKNLQPCLAEHKRGIS